MERGYITKLAALTGYRNSTVSRVLNRRAGVDSAVRESVLRAAQEVGLPPAEKAEAVLIVPAIPSYFWAALERAATAKLEDAGIRPRVSVYTKLADTETQLAYLADAEASGARLILAALGRDERVLEQVERLAEKTAIFLLCEDLRCPGTCYFGSDYLEEGTMLGKACADRLENHGELLVIGRDSRRVEGIRRGYPGRVRILEFQAHGSSSASARLARLLATEPVPCGLVSTGGETAMMCLAAEKCRWNVPCFGFEQAPADVGYIRSGRLAAIVGQDLPGIAAAAAKVGRDVLDGTPMPPARTILPPICWP